MNLAIWLERQALRAPERPAIAVGHTVWCNYREFSKRSSRVAQWLQEQGVEPGDRVAIFMANCPEYLPLLWGIWWAGAVAVPINAKLHNKEAAWIVQHCEARLILCGAENASSLRQTLADAPEHPLVQHDFSFMHDERRALVGLQERADHDPTWLFYTSGTTGRPKGVILGPAQLRESVLGFYSGIQSVEPDDVMLHPAPLSHGGGLYHLPYVLQGALNVIPASGGFDADECLALAAHWRRASFFAAPTMVQRLVDSARVTKQPVEGLSTIVYGGGPMYLAHIEAALDVIGPHFAQIYGQGECPMTITVLPRSAISDDSQPRYRERLSSVGFAQPMIELSIREAGHKPLPSGSIGEVCVRGPAVMNGYWNDPVATADALRDGWLATGDMGRLDDDGYLFLVDRSKDLIISGGTNIYPREVEETLLQHPDVSEASVIGRPDVEWGEVVVAFIVASRELNPAELDAYCLANMARFKRPRHYRLVSTLPKNNYGKVLKTALRELDSTLDAGEARSTDSDPKA